MSDDIKVIDDAPQGPILGVVAGTEAPAPVPAPVVKTTPHSDIARANASLLQVFAGRKGVEASHGDILETLTLADPDAAQSGTDAGPAAMAAGLGATGLDARVETASHLPTSAWPALCHMTNGEYVMVLGQEDDDTLSVYDVATPDRPMSVLTTEFEPYFTGVYITANSTVDQLKQTHIAKGKKAHWFWGEFTKFRAILGDITVGSLVANMLAVSVALFSLQVYDRVIPHESTSTLFVLALGAFLALGLEALIKLSRARLMDGAGRAIDLKVQDLLMKRLLGMRSDKRPMPPSGLFATMREFSSIREFFTASTIGAVADIPFIFVFLLLVASIGGPVVWVLVAGGILMVLPGYFMQKKMMRLTQEAQGANAKSSRLLHEVIFELDTVKSQRGEARVERLWNELNGLQSLTSSEQRRIATWLTHWSQSVQQATYVTAVIAGTFLIFAGQMSVGSIIAIGILTGRTLSPLTQLASTMARWSNVKTALDGLDHIEAAPQDNAEDRVYLRRDALAGQFDLREVTFRYDEDGPKVVDIPAIRIQAGQKVALLGSNGSGKSTLLKLLAGLYSPDTGSIMLDGLDMSQIDPRDVRRSVGYLGQDVRLFAGTLRDNLNLNNLERDDDRLLAALDFSGLGEFVRNHPRGLDLEIRDGGEGLSIGQRQSIGWARLWLQDPKICLLDEPTSALDQTLETALISRMEEWLKGRTALIATHRIPILALTERTTILQNGRMAVDGPRNDVLAHLKQRKEAQS